MIGPLLLGAAALTALLLSAGKSAGTTGTQSPGQPSVTPGKSPSDSTLSDAIRMQIAQVLRDLGVDDNGNLTCPNPVPANMPTLVQAATTLAAQLDQMGAPVAAQQLRAYATQAAKCVPTPPPSKSVPLPSSIPPDLQAQINRALLLEGDPAILRGIAVALRALPDQNAQVTNAEQLLDAKASQIEASMMTAAALTKTQQVLATSPGLPQMATPAPTPPVLVPAVPTPQPLPAAKSPQQQLAESTALMLTRVQQNASSVKASKGKEDQAMVLRFQKQEGLTADGKAGPGTLVALAKYVAVLPWVMYWPKSANKTTVLGYRNALNTLADSSPDPMRAAGLRASAAHEHGEAGIVGPMPA